VCMRVCERECGKVLRAKQGAYWERETCSLSDMGVWGGRGREKSSLLCQWALTERRTLRAAAHSRSVICVFLRMAAIAVAPLAPILLPMRL
jgi:hypothetical protein